MAMQGSYFAGRGSFPPAVRSGQGGAFRQVGATKIAVFTVVNALGTDRRSRGPRGAVRPLARRGRMRDDRRSPGVRTGHASQRQRQVERPARAPTATPDRARTPRSRWWSPISRCRSPTSSASPSRSIPRWPAPSSRWRRATTATCSTPRPPARSSYTDLSVLDLAVIPRPRWRGTPFSPAFPIPSANCGCRSPRPWPRRGCRRWGTARRGGPP